MNKFKEFDFDTVQIVKAEKSPTNHPRRPETIAMEKKLYQLLENLQVDYEFTLPDRFYPYLKELAKLFSDRIYKVRLLRPHSKDVCCKRIQ
jgi:hypothetical protein